LVIWITGLSGAGKTTLCVALRAVVKPHLPEFVVLDGDDVRAAFGDDLGHSEAHRTRQFRRLQSIARVLAEQNLAVAVAAVYAHPDLLAWNRRHLRGYFEIYLKASLETVRRRDPKGLYAKADAGTMPDVVGLDIPWHEPQSPDLVLDADHPDPPAVLADRVVRAVPRLAERVGEPRKAAG